MLKDRESSYHFGEKSRKQGWVKIKPEYANMTEDIDLIVLGGYYGEGQRRSGMLSHFVLGVVKERVAHLSVNAESSANVDPSSDVSTIKPSFKPKG